MGIDAMFAFTNTVTKSFSGGSGLEVLPPASPERMTQAIKLVEEEEGQVGQMS